MINKEGEGRKKDPKSTYDTLRSIVQVLMDRGNVDEANKLAQEMVIRWPKRCLNNNSNGNYSDEKK